MELIRTWLMGVTAAALVAALADSLAPEGAAKKIGKLAGGLLMVVAILQPLVKLDDSALAAALAELRLENAGYSTALETENERLMKRIIEEQTGAYIQDKAAQLGFDCTAQVTCQENEEGALYPASVTVYGELSQAQTDALTRLIQGDLAIPAEEQHYERTKER
jgi:stage III sporulation protein AF